MACLATRPKLLIVEGVILNGVRDEAGTRHGIKYRHPKCFADLVGVGWELAALTENATKCLVLGLKLNNFDLDFFLNAWPCLCPVNRRAFAHFVSETRDILEAKHFDLILRSTIRELLEHFFEGSSIRREHEHNLILGDHLQHCWEHCKGRHEARGLKALYELAFANDIGDDLLDAAAESTVAHNNLDFACQKCVHGALQTFVDLLRAVLVCGHGIRFNRLDRPIRCIVNSEIDMLVDELVRVCVAVIEISIVVRRQLAGNDLTGLPKGAIVVFESSLDNSECQAFRAMKECPET